MKDNSDDSETLRAVNGSSDMATDIGHSYSPNYQSRPNGLLPIMANTTATLEEGLSMQFKQLQPFQAHDHQAFYRLLIWSAADEETLKTMVDRYKSYCATRATSTLADLDKLAYTLANRRSLMIWRSFTVVTPLSLTMGISPATYVRASPNARAAFVFTGQGAQYAGMGLDLIRYPIFRDTLAKCDSAFRELGCEWSIVGKPCYPPPV